jgi:hypothetical protein
MAILFILALITAYEIIFLMIACIEAICKTPLKYRSARCIYRGPILKRTFSKQKILWRCFFCPPPWTMRNFSEGKINRNLLSSGISFRNRCIYNVAVNDNE